MDFKANGLTEPASPQNVAILTGDLIGSTKVAREDVERSFVVLAGLAQDIAGWAGADTRMTRFRGDGWQMLIANPDLALRAAIILLARMRAPNSPLATRIAIGIGPISSVGTKDLSDASGEAFTQSGHALDGMAAKAWTLSISGQYLTHLQVGFVNLVEAILRRWTPEQAEALSIYLQPDQPILEDIAKQLGISIQAASYRIRGGAGNDLRSALTLWEQKQQRFA